MASDTSSVSSQIESLKVGETISFPLAKLRNVRTRASELGLQSGRRYKTSTSRERQVVTVHRTA